MTIDGTDWFAIVAGIIAIAAVNWYFFVAARSSATDAAANESRRREPHA